MAQRCGEEDGGHDDEWADGRTQVGREDPQGDRRDRGDPEHSGHRRGDRRSFHPRWPVAGGRWPGAL